MTSDACRLVPINLHNPEEYGALQAQRVACGWYSESAVLNRWRDAMDTRQKALFWITVDSRLRHDISASSISAPGDDAAMMVADGCVCAGHISLDSMTEHPDPQHELAHPSKSLLTISTFFIDPRFQGHGIGRKAMSMVEDLALVEPYGSPHCRAIAITSLSKRYVDDDSWRAQYREWTNSEPLSYEDWYARMGYVKWKEEPYIKETAVNGEEFMLVEAFMKKLLVRKSA